MFERSDETLVKQALKGKKSAWVTLVKRYEKNLYNYTLRMVSNPDDALDLMQDVFMAVFRNLASFRGDSPFKGWLFKIAHYRCIEFYRRKKPTQSLDDAPEQQEQSDDTCPEAHFFSGQQASLLKKAMQTLPVNQKLVVELKFFQHCTFDDISKQLGVSVNTVKSRLYSALDKLKDHLELDHVK
ncbi:MULTISPECIES: sigma-70 family RNA polymerase sigma factor [unclassified Colwellia]|uniref:RNA polymerase sigma factor n=1 Tax=unclassified Colwellia TaxID=196834 RepID=UPI000D3A129F|nr:MULTISPECIES: sigma-70 family RNA polymerase sigma factor [unclassified Colwellia]AWB58821.1 RNA polymerase subunit sigma-70 [Colwellia sp. Arc7-D]MBA6414709.1 sigma-70 family RNA polymerase sigma factor [Colwellia sp. 6M3]